jgi:hypothetical protein
MRRNHFIILVGSLLLLLAFGTSTAAARATGQLLYVTTTGDLRITGAHGNIRVSLPARATLTWFSNRPARRAGTSTAASLAAGWNANGFARVPPNAALITQRAGRSMQTIITLTQPIRRQGRVSFSYRVLDDGRMLGMRTSGHPHVGRYHGELFVDDATVPPCTLSVFGLATVDAGTSQSCVMPEGVRFDVELNRPGTAEIRVCGANGPGSLGIPSTDWHDPFGETHVDVPACPLAPDAPVQGVLTVQPTSPWAFCTTKPEFVANDADTDLVVTTAYAAPSSSDPQIPLAD